MTHLATSCPPALVLLAGAALLPFVRGRARHVVALVLPVLALALSWLAIRTLGGTGGLGVEMPFLGQTLQPIFVHGPTPVFATIFCLMVFGGVVFAMNQKRTIELPAAFVYAGGALGVVFAGDWITMFVFWEVMTLGSTIILWSARSSDSFRVGMRYFGVHAFGGVLLVMGIVLHVMTQIQAGAANPLAFAAIPDLITGWTHLGWDNLPAWMILVGMLVNAGAPPFSAWIGDAYPEASESGTVFLSAFTTKTAVFTLMIAFAGTPVLIYVGLYMALYGIVYAILENDMRRILAYSIVNQVGFMVVGIGIGTELALNGATAHAFAHIIYKALLLMSAGSVLYATGKKKCTELGGLWRTMPVTMWCGIIGALAISSFPLTSGFTTKTMIAASTTELAHTLGESGLPHKHLLWTWFLLEAASAGVFLHAGIKFPWFVFFQKDRGLRPAEVPWNMRAAMIGFAGLCLFLGVFPGLLYSILPHPAAAHAFGAHVYDGAHLVAMLQMLLFAGLAFFLLLPMLKRTRTLTLDTDWLYRRAFPLFWRKIVVPAYRSMETTTIVDPETARPKPKISVAATWAVSYPVLMIAMMLLAYLVVYLKA